MNKYEVIIIGGGPAGLTAGIYSSRAGLKTLLIERAMFGGQIVNAQIVENYPGFPDGISGFELASLMQKQATKYGLETSMTEVTGIKAGKTIDISTSDASYQADALIIAAGAEHRKLGVKDEEEYLGRGISYCATCDGFLFRNQDVAVVGGGDTAITDALELTHHASKVYLIHRRDQLRGSQILQERAFAAQPKLNFIWNTVIDEVIGEGMAKGLKLRNVKTNDVSNLAVSGIFVAVGVTPNTQAFADLVKLDDAGNIVTDELMATSVPGIFAAGDIRGKSARQVSSAVGDGATAALSAFKYLRERS